MVQYTAHPLTKLSPKRSSHDASGSKLGIATQLKFITIPRVRVTINIIIGIYTVHMHA